MNFGDISDTDDGKDFHNHAAGQGVGGSQEQGGARRGQPNPGRRGIRVRGRIRGARVKVYRRQQGRGRQEGVAPQRNAVRANLEGPMHGIQGAEDRNPYRQQHHRVVWEQENAGWDVWLTANPADPNRSYCRVCKQDLAYFSSCYSALLQ